jgi:hypothetical protein
LALLWRTKLLGTCCRSTYTEPLDVLILNPEVEIKSLFFRECDRR